MSNKFPHIKLKDFLDRDPEKFESNPRRAWAILFLLEIFLVALVLTVHVYVYVYTRTDTSFKAGGNTGMNEIKLNRKGLEDVTAMFGDKNAKFQNLLDAPPRISDPSEAGAPQPWQASSSTPATTTGTAPGL